MAISALPMRRARHNPGSLSTNQRALVNFDGMDTHAFAPFTFNTTPSVIFEPGAARRFGVLAGRKLGRVVLFVTDPGLRKLGLCDQAIASLEAEGATVTVFDGVEADPSRQTLEKAVEAGLTAGATGVAGFGGGSSLDVAKLAALLIGSGEDLDAAWGVAQAKGPRLPLALVPTTAGTGSEVTPVSIITVGEEEKRGVSSPIILPDIAVLDAELTLGLPPAITAATGIDQNRSAQQNTRVHRAK